MTTFEIIYTVDQNVLVSGITDYMKITHGIPSPGLLDLSLLPSFPPSSLALLEAALSEGDTDPPLA